MVILHSHQQTCPRKTQWTWREHLQNVTWCHHICGGYKALFAMLKLCNMGRRFHLPISMLITCPKIRNKTYYETHVPVVLLTLTVHDFCFLRVLFRTVDVQSSSGPILHHLKCSLCLKEGTVLQPQSLCPQLPSLIRTAQALCFYWHHLLSSALANKSSLLSG